MRHQPGTSHCLAMPCQWRALPSGVHYQSALQAHLDRWWPKICGPHLLKLGDLSIDLSYKGCMAIQQVSFSLPHPPAVTAGVETIHLPFSNNWFDVCLLAHTLAYATNPYDILRETDRVLTDQGWLLISGFNPWSLLGIGKLLPVLRHQQPYGSLLLRCRRVVDWLYLLNYQVLSQDLFQVFPWRGTCRIAGLPDDCLSLFGCQYLIVARKQIVPLQPIRSRLHYQPSWQKPVGVCHNNTLNGCASSG